MTDLWVLLPAVILPWVTGILLVYAIDRRIAFQDLGYACAFGYLLGIVLAATLYAIQLRVFALTSPRWAAAMLVGVAISSILIAQERQRSERQAAPVTQDKKSTLWRIFFVLVVSKVSLLIYEGLRQPVVSWDAWTTWLFRSRVWIESGAYTPFVDAANALQLQTGYSIEAWHYPELVSWIAAWSASWGAGWSETKAVLPWAGIAVALPLGLYAAVRRAGLPSTGAMIAAFVLVSLPLVGTHLAMTGYADIWLATALSFALMSVYQWLRTQHQADVVFAGVFLLIAACAKPEGVVWAAVLPLAYFATRASPRVFFVLLIAGVTLIALFFSLRACDSLCLFWALLILVGRHLLIDWVGTSGFTETGIYFSSFCHQLLL